MIDVAVVGGGPVGLYLASLLLQEGISVRVYEQRHQHGSHSRAIGIHPPALEALDRIGCADPLIQRGVTIRSGIAFSNGRRLAGMDFSVLQSRYPFVLSSPQTVTESVLEERLLMLDGGALTRGATVTAYSVQDSHVELSIDASVAGSGAAHREDRIKARWCVVASGARSAAPARPCGQTVHPERIRTREYRDSYVMGDFTDSTSFGNTAVLFLERDGIVESFPLPGRIRRWVARVNENAPDRTADWLAGVVGSRTGTTPDSASCTMISSFGVRSGMLPHLISRRVVTIGDAAHEVSPIGGQGMNLGWLDAVELVPFLKLALAGSPATEVAQEFERSRRRAAARAALQSEINMMLGRPAPAPVLAVRNRLISAAAGFPALNSLVAHRFTMQ